MEVSAVKYTGAVGLHGRSPLLRLQSDERLINYIRRGNHSAFEALVSRYESRLLSFCRHLLGSREDAEDVLQEVFAAAFNAIQADDRPINVRPWLYRIARNRSLNHLRRTQAIGVDSMDIHLSEHGETTADKVHHREEFRLLVSDIQDLPESQRTALLLREMEALSYEQISEAMETTVPSVKSLLVRARVSLAEAAEARLLSCEEVRIELGEIAEGLRRRPSPLVRRHLKACDRCASFRVQLRDTNKALAALLPIGPLIVLKKLALVHLGHSASAGSGATASGATAASSATAAGSTVVGGSAAGGVVSAGLGAVAGKAAAGLAAAALVTAGAVEVDHSSTSRHHHATATAPAQSAFQPSAGVAKLEQAQTAATAPKTPPAKKTKPAAKPNTPALVASTNAAPVTPAKPTTTTATTPTPPPPAGRTQTQSNETVLPTTLTPSTTSTTPTTTGTSSTPPPSAGTQTTPGSESAGSNEPGGYVPPATNSTSGSGPSSGTSTTSGATTPTPAPDPNSPPGS